MDIHGTTGAKLQKLQVYVPQSTKDRIEAVAASEQRSTSQFVERVVTAWLDSRDTTDQPGEATR